MSKKDCAIDRELARIALFLGALAINSLAIMPGETRAAPLDYEIGNASVRSCKLVYSDGRPDEPLPSCEGTKDFGNVSASFAVKMVMTNEINQDVTSSEITIAASSNPEPIGVYCIGSSRTVNRNMVLVYSGVIPAACYKTLKEAYDVNYMNESVCTLIAIRNTVYNYLPLKGLPPDYNSTACR